MHTAVKQVIPIVLGRLTPLVIGVVGVKLVSTLIPPSAYGPYALFLTLTHLGYLLTHSGLINHAQRYWQRETPRAGSYARFLWTMNWRNTLYLLPILVTPVLATALPGREWAWLAALPLLLIANVAIASSSLVSGILTARERYWRVFGFGTARSLRVFFPLAAAWLFGVSFLVLATGFALHGIVLMAGIALFCRWMWRFPVASVDTRNMWLGELKAYGRPFVLMGVSSWLLQYADRWVLATTLGNRQVGLFTLAVTMAGIVPTFVLGVLMQWGFPKVFRRADAARTGQDWRRLARGCDIMTATFLVATVTGLALLQLVGPYLVGWLVHPRYTEAMAILLPAGLAVANVGANQFHYLLLQGQHNSAGIVRIMLIAAAVKTLGSAVAALVSWEAFLAWHGVSLLIALVLGRTMVRRLALSNGGKTTWTD